MNVSVEKPCIINISTHGNDGLGYIAVAEQIREVPFDVKRVFWTYGIPDGCIRGNHAHRNTRQLLICLHGIIEITTEMPDRSQAVFVLNKPTEGLYLPPSTWHTMKYSANTIQLVLASSEYDESDYLRSYREYEKYYR